MLRLKKLYLNHVGGVKHALLSLQENGIFVISGDNEQGKSTLLHAFLLLIGDDPLTSKRAQLRTLKSTFADEAIRVGAELILGKKTITIDKQFKLGSGTCTLTIESADHWEQLTGAQAINRFSELLTKEIDKALLSALILKQGESLTPLSLHGIQSLEYVLAEYSHTDNGHTQMLIDAIYGEYNQYYSEKRSQESRKLKQSKENYHEAERAYQTAYTAYQSAQDLIKKVAHLQKQRHALEDMIGKAEANLKEAQQHLQKSEKIYQAYEQKNAEHKTAYHRLEIAQEHFKQRQNAIQSEKKRQEKQHQLGQQIAQLSQEVEKFEHTVHEIEDRLSAALDEKRLCETLIQAVHCWQEIEEKENKSNALTQLSLQLAAQQASSQAFYRALDKNLVTEPALHQLEKAIQALNIARVRQEKNSTELIIEGKKGAIYQVNGQKKQLGAAGDRLNSAHTHQLILGDFSIRILASSETKNHQAAVEQAERMLMNQLQKMDVPSVQAAYTAASERKKIEQQIKHLETELLKQSKGQDLAAIQIEAHTAQEAVLHARVTWTEMKKTLALLKPTHRVFEHIQQSLLAEHPNQPGMLTTLYGEKESLDNAIASLQEKNRSLRDSPVKARYQALLFSQKQLKNQQYEETKALATARENKTDEALTLQVEKAQENWRYTDQQLTSLHDQLKEQLKGSDLSYLKAAQETLVRQVAELHRQYIQLCKQLSHAEGELAAHQGIGEKLQYADAQLQRAKRQYHFVEKQAKAAKLLLHTIEKAQQGLQEKYALPFKTAFENLARPVFGDSAQFIFDTELSLKTRALNGQVVNRSQLSGGAQEQIALLSRLAIATLVGKGSSVPIFIDDALGFADPKRLQKMNVVLSQLGRHHQVIILSCNRQRFANLEGAMHIAMDTVLHPT